MGLRDTEEQLEAAQAQSVIDERTIADLTQQIATLTEQVARMSHRIATVRRVLAAERLSLQDSEGAGFDVVEAWKIERVLDADPEDHP